MTPLTQDQAEQLKALTQQAIEVAEERIRPYCRAKGVYAPGSDLIWSLDSDGNLEGEYYSCGETDTVYLPLAVTTLNEEEFTAECERVSAETAAKKAADEEAVQRRREAGERALLQQLAEKYGVPS